MNDKEKYLELMQRYFDAETTPEEERELALYAASTDDPDFKGLRGVLGYLSIGRQKKAEKVRTVRFLPWAVVAAGIAAIVTIGLSHGTRMDKDICIRYAYGEKTEDSAQIMTSVESSLAGFFAGDSPAETTLKELFQR